MLSYQFVFFLFPVICQFSKIAFFKKGVQNFGFSLFGVLSLNFENSLSLGLLKHYKIGFQQFVVFCC